MFLQDEGRFHAMSVGVSHRQLLPENLSLKSAS